MAEIRPWSELEPEVRKLPPEQQQAARESYFQMLIDRGVYQAPGSHSGARVPKDPALGAPIPEEGPQPAGDLTGETRPSEFLAPKAALLGQLGRMAGPGEFALGRPRLVTHPETGELVTPEQAREHRVLRPVEAFEAGAASSPFVRFARGRAEPFEPSVGWRGAVERGAGALGRVAPGATAVGLGQLAGLPAPVTAPAVFGGEAGLGEYQREQEAGEPTSPLRIGAAGVGTGALVAGAPVLGKVAGGLAERLAGPVAREAAGVGTEAATFGVGGEVLQSRLEGRPYDPAEARESTATGGALFGTLRVPSWLRSLREEAAPVNEPARTTPGTGEGAPRADEPAFVAGLRREPKGPRPRIAPPAGQAYAGEPPVQEAEIVPDRLALPPPRAGGGGGTVTGGPVVPPGPVEPPTPGEPAAPMETRPAPGPEGGQVVEPAGVPGLDYPEAPGATQAPPVAPTPPPPAPAPPGRRGSEAEAVLERLRGGLRGKGRAPEPGATGTEAVDRAQIADLQKELAESERVAREETNPKGRPLPAGMVADAARDAERLRARLRAVGAEPPAISAAVPAAGALGAQTVQLGPAQSWKTPDSSFHAIMDANGKAVGEVAFVYHPERKLLDLDWLAGAGETVKPKLGVGAIRQIVAQGLKRYPDAEQVRYERASGAAAERLGHPDRILPAALLRARTGVVGAEPAKRAAGATPTKVGVPPELEAVFQGKARAFLRPPPEEGTVPTAGEQALAGTDLRALARSRRASYFKGKDGSEVVFDPQQVSRRELSGLDKAGRLAEVVNGEGTSPKPAAPTEAVVVRTPAGDEARTVLTATPAATEAAIRAQPEGFSTEVAPAETAIPKVLGERAATREAVPYAASRRGIQRLYHETDPEMAAALATANMDRSGLQVSADPDLALGQHGKGAVVEFVDTDRIGVQALRGKPGARAYEAIHGQPAEYEWLTGPRSGSVASVTLKPGAVFGRVETRRFKAMGWQQEKLPDGSVRYTPPGTAPKPTGAIEGIPPDLAAEPPGSREAVRAAMGKLGPEEAVAAAQRLQALVERINDPEKAPKTPAALHRLIDQARQVSRSVGLGIDIPGAHEALERARGRQDRMAAERFDVYGHERYADPELERLRLAVERANAEAPQKVYNVRQQQKSDQRIANAQGELEGALRAYREYAGGEPERLPPREVPPPRGKPGERGSFSLRPRKPLPLPAQKVMEHVSVGEKEPRDLTLSTLYTRAVDDLYPMKEMSDELGKADSFAENPYILGRLQRGWQGRAEHFIEKGPFRFGDLERVPGPSLHDVFAPVLGEIEEARAYLVARHALELAAKGKETGIPTDAARETVRLLDSPRMRELVRAHQQYWDGVTRYVADAGLLTPEARARIAGAYEAYVPFQRVVEALRTGGTGRRFGNIPSPIRRLVGSERAIIDPIESDVKNTFAFVNAAERNRVAQSIANLADAPGGGNWIKRVPPPFRLLRVGEAEVVGKVAKGLSASPGEVRDALRDEFGVDLPESFLLALRPQSFLPPESRTIAVMVGGRPRYYQLEPSLYRATMGLDREPSNMVVRILSIPSRLLRAGATITPEFWTRNIVRDQMTAFLQSEYQVAPPVNFLRGLFHAIKRDDLFWEYQRSGAAHSALVSLDRPYVQEAVRKMTEPPDMVDHIIGGVSHPISLMEAWSELGEMATRLADFEAGKAKERPGVEGLLRRGYNAREVTVDFGRMGASMQAVNSLIAFSNARIQGVDRFARAFKDNPYGTSARVAAGIMVPSLLLWAAFHDDKRYQDRPAYERDQFWIIPTDKGVMRIPKPFEPGILFGSAVERALDYWKTKDPRGVQQWTQSFLQGMSPGFMPTAIGPLVDVWSNQSSMSGRPIVPRGKEDVEPRYQSTDYTTELARRVGDVVNYSPAKIDALIRGYTGGIGLLTAEGISALMNLQRPTTTGEAPTRTWADVPVARSFVGREPSTQSDEIERFYETYQRASEAAKTYTTLKTQDPEHVDAYGEQHEAALDLAKGLGPVAHQFTLYRKAIEGVRDDPNLPGPAKRVAIDNLVREMNEAARDVNAEVAGTQKGAPPPSGPGALERILRLIRPAPSAEAR